MRTIVVRGLITAALITVLPGSGQAQRWTLDADSRRQVDQVFSFVGRDDPGCALGIVRDGQLVYGRGYGLANLDWGIPISISTVFDIGSVAKQFTATAIALLDIDGVLSIDDEVTEWVPELPTYGRSLTIRHLLNHTSGIRDYLTLMRLAGHDFDNVFDEFMGVEMISRQQDLNFPAGDEYLYSNSGYLLLANIVRRASGQSLREYLQERVFDPLGMAHTSIWDDNTEVVQRRATGYGARGGGWTIHHAWNFQMGGDGQVLTSIDDLVRWDANFYNPQVGGEALLDRLHTRGILNDGDTIPYALGLFVDEYRGVRRVHHGGAWAGFRAQFTRFPDHHTSIAVLCNRVDANPGGYAAAVSNVVLNYAFMDSPDGDEVEEDAPAVGDPVDLTEAQLRRWQGAYRAPDGGNLILFAYRDDQLFAITQGTMYGLVAYSETEFRVRAVGLPVTFAADGEATTARFLGRTLTRFEQAEVPAEALPGYVGRYTSTELGVSYEITLEEETLMLTPASGDPVTMMALTDTEFAAAGLTLTFSRVDGEVTEFRVNAGRVTGIVFRKEGT